MKFHRLFPVLILLWQCASPPHAPLPSWGVDDDHRLVSRAEFAASPWMPLGAVKTWQATASGITLTLADGRGAALTFPSPDVVRWWVAAAPGEQPLSPGAQYPVHAVSVTVREDGGTVTLDTPSLSVRVQLKDLSWTLIRGDTAVLRTAGGPRAAGRRMLQAFAAADTTWFGPGLETDSAAKFWISRDDESVGPWAQPALFGLGALPVAVLLDNSYQTYTRVTAAEVSLGALNGGLDLLVSAAPRPESVIEALTALTGRPPALPSWAEATTLALPADETGGFLRQARVSVGTAFGTPADRHLTRFRQLVPAPSSAAGAGSLLSYQGSDDWNTAIDDGGMKSPLARMNNRMPALQAQAAAKAAATPVPLLTTSAGPGTVRWAVPEMATGGTGTLARALNLGLAGLGTPAIRLDLSGLGSPDTKEATFRSLLAWLMAPLLRLDWGPDPAAFWNHLSDADKKRLTDILDARSQFQPLFLEAVRKTAATGIPAWTPVWFANTRDPQALVSDEFLLGDLIVAPCSPDVEKRKVYLPGPGVWFDFWSGEEYGGGRSYEVAFQPDQPLLFARGGGFVPTRNPDAYDGREIVNPVTMHVFPGGRGEGTYYYDDGVSAGTPGTFFETRILYDYDQREMTLEHQSVATAGIRPEAYMLYRLHNVYQPRQVTIDNKPVPLFGPSWGVTESDRSAAWYEDDRTLLIKTFRPERNQLIQMSF